VEEVESVSEGGGGGGRCGGGCAGKETREDKLTNSPPQTGSKQRRNQQQQFSYLLRDVEKGQASKQASRLSNDGNRKWKCEKQPKAPIPGLSSDCGR
jgi:hypothetical protein